MPARFTLGAGQRLKREKEIQALFHSGKALSVFPLRVVWRLYSTNHCTSAIHAGFSVSKKRFKHAVDRNRIKRQMREQYRLCRHLLEPEVLPGHNLDLFLLYNHSKAPQSSDLKDCIEILLKQLKLIIENQPDA